MIMHRYTPLTRFFLGALLLALLIVGLIASPSPAQAQVVSTSTLGSAFEQAASASGVPAPLLKALCYLEGRLSNHGGSPSIDHGFGCMHLINNARADTLDQAASLLHVSTDQLKIDIATNIRGGAAVLHVEAVQLSRTHTLPANLAGWYGAVAFYSHATTRSTALLYANALYALLNTGFRAQTERGETVSLPPQAVKPDTATAAGVKGASTLPTGCTLDSNVEYPAAVDCLLNPNLFDCNIVSPGTTNNPCTFIGANRPTDFAINSVVIHDIEGTAQDALTVFQDVNSGVSVHYIVDSDGTVFQVVHEKDIAFHAGNFWSNEHSVGIEHAGFDATGFQWYNAAEYLGSAKLVAYLLKKYHLPLDRMALPAHGTVPAPAAAFAPNHVDPGPYWLWDYYFQLIHEQGVPFPVLGHTAHTIQLHTQKHIGPGGKESPADFNFFYLYTGPSTNSGLIPQGSNGTDITDETDNVEAGMSYFFLAKVKDPAGTGDTMYEIWYGESDQVHATPSSQFENAHLAWLAVPPNTATEGTGTLVTLNLSGATVANVYGRPTTDSFDIIGDAPNGAVFVSGYTVIEDGTNNRWYEINYNHRQAFVPANEVTIVHATPAT